MLFLVSLDEGVAERNVVVAEVDLGSQVHSLLALACGIRVECSGDIADISAVQKLISVEDGLELKVDDVLETYRARWFISEWTEHVEGLGYAEEMETKVRNEGGADLLKGLILRVRQPQALRDAKQ